MRSLEKGQILNFGIRNNGFVFALQKRLRLDQFEDDFGVSGYFMECNKNQDFILMTNTNELYDMTSRIYKNIFSRHFSADKCDPRIKLYDVGLMMPYLQSNEVRVFNEDEVLTESIYIDSLLIFPLNPAYLHFFLVRSGTKKKNLYALLNTLNLIDFGFMEVRFRKCVVETSVKAKYDLYDFFLICHIWSYKRLRKTADKMEKLVELSDQIWDFIKVRFSLEGKRKLLVTFDPSETVYLTSFNVSDYGLTNSQIEEKNLRKQQEQDKLKELNECEEDEENNEDVGKEEQEHEHEKQYNDKKDTKPKPKNELTNQQNQLPQKSNRTNLQADDDKFEENIIDSYRENDIARFNTHQQDQKLGLNTQNLEYYKGQEDQKLVTPRGSQLQNDFSDKHESKKQIQENQTNRSKKTQDNKSKKNIENQSKKSSENQSKTSKQEQKPSQKSIKDIENPIKIENQKYSQKEVQSNSSKNKDIKKTIEKIEKENEKQSETLKSLKSIKSQKQKDIGKKFQEEQDDPGKMAEVAQNLVLGQDDTLITDINNTDVNLLPDKLDDQSHEDVLSEHEEMNKSVYSRKSQKKVGKGYEVQVGDEDKFRDEESEKSVYSNMSKEDLMQIAEKQRKELQEIQEQMKIENQQSMGSTVRSSALNSLSQRGGRSANSMIVNFQEVRQAGAGQDGSSVTSASDLHMQKESFINCINSKIFPPVMRNIVIFGVIAMVVLTSVTSILFFSLKANFDAELYAFNNIVTSTNLMAEFAAMIKENEFLRLADNGYFLREVEPEKIEFSVKNKETVVTLFKQKISLFMNENEQAQYSVHLQNQEMTMICEIPN